MKAMNAFCAGVALMAAAAGATPVVSNVQVTQGADRTVTVRYALAGAPAVVTMNVQTNDGAGGWADIGGANVWSRNRSGAWSPSGDVFGRVEGDGAHAFTWKPDRSWPDRRLAAGEARIVVTAWAPEDAPDYLSVDLASGAAGWYPSADYVPGGVLSNESYRTTSLLLRRMHARGIPWTMGNMLEKDRRADREDVHAVTLTNDYYVGVFEVTQRQWREGGGTLPSALTDRHDLRPMQYVSYEDVRDKGAAASAWPSPPHAESWLGRLRVRTGVDFDLPGEAEWEFACRAGTIEGHWNTGVRYADTYHCGRYDQNHGDATTAVCGSYEPSLWGLYDMHGNVLEWCLDWGRKDIAALNGAVNVEQDPSVGAMRVIRGGGWNMPSGYMRSSFRAWNRATTRVADYGFRVACRAGLK